MYQKKDSVGGSVWRTEIKITGEQFRTLAVAGNLELTAEQEAKIEECLDDYDLEKRMDAVAPEYRELVARAEEIRKLSNRMQEFVEAKTRMDKTLLARIRSEDNGLHQEFGLDSGHFVYLKARLNAVILRYSHHLPYKDGPEADAVFNRLLIALLTIYKSARKKSRTIGSGQFAFIKAALDILPTESRPRIQSDDALRQRIKRLSSGT